MIVGSIFVFAGCSATTDKSKTATSESKDTEVIQSKIKQIEKNVEKILAEKDKDTKLLEYKKFVTEDSTYSKSDKKEDKITKIYTESIKKIKMNFKEQDDRDLKENTLDNIEKSTEEDLYQKINSLDKLKKWIQKESTDVYSKEEIDSLIKKIDDTITTYKNQLEKIKIDNQETTSTESSEVAISQENVFEEPQVPQTNLLNSIEEAAQYLGQKYVQSGGASAFKNGRKNPDGSFTFDYQLYGNEDGVTWNTMTVNGNGEVVQDSYLKTVPNEIADEVAKNSESTPGQPSISELEAVQLALAKHNELGLPSATLSETETTVDGYCFYYLSDVDGTFNVYKYFVSNSGQVQVGY